MCDELLNESLFFDLAHARQKISAWADDDNNARPHSSAHLIATGPPSCAS